MINSKVVVSTAVGVFLATLAYEAMANRGITKPITG